MEVGLVYAKVEIVDRKRPDLVQFARLDFDLLMIGYFCEKISS